MGYCGCDWIPSDENGLALGSSGLFLSDELANEVAGLEDVSVCARNVEIGGRHLEAGGADAGFIQTEPTNHDRPSITDGNPHRAF